MTVHAGGAKAFEHLQHRGFTSQSVCPMMAITGPPLTAHDAPCWVAATMVSKRCMVDLCCPASVLNGESGKLLVRPQPRTLRNVAPLIHSPQKRRDLSGGGKPSNSHTDPPATPAGCCFRSSVLRCIPVQIVPAGRDRSIGPGGREQASRRAGLR